MTINQCLILINGIILFIIAKLLFKTFSNFFKSVYWFLFPNWLSIWRKEIWEKDFDYSFKMIVFLIFVAVLFGLNVLVLQVISNYFS